MRSMISESSTMLIANGHRPTPASTPFCVSDSPNSTPHASIENARRMKQNDVATSAAKHTAKVFRASADSGSAPVIVASVLIRPPQVIWLDQILVQALLALPDFSTASMKAMTRAPVTPSGAYSDA